MLLISGEAGIGKSSLVTHFVQSQQTIHRVLWGSCDDLFTPRPLGPLHDIARQVGGQLLELLRSPQERSLLLNAVLNQLQSPVIVVFEDIHWADEATLDLLKFLGRRMTRTQALLLITFRDDELDQRHPLYLLLGDLNRQSTTRRLRLAPLSVTAVEQLSSGFGVDAGRLHQETGGNPFYLREILAAKEDGIPTSIREVVLARVARLSLSGRAVLEAAAIIGPRVEPWLLNQVVQAEAPAISESLKFGFLQANADFFTFRHELVRQTIVDSLPLHQRAFWHQAVLDVLRNAAQTSHDTARLAHHAAAAQDVEAILHFGRAAGKRRPRWGCIGRRRVGSISLCHMQTD